MPSHTHNTLTTIEIAVSNNSGTDGNADGQFIAAHTNAFNASATIGESLASGSTAATLNNAGNGQPHNNMQPSVAIHYIIALQGLFPPRN